MLTCIIHVRTTVQAYLRLPMATRHTPAVCTCKPSAACDSLLLPDRGLHHRPPCLLPTKCDTPGPLLRPQVLPYFCSKTLAERRAWELAGAQTRYAHTHTHMSLLSGRSSTLASATDSCAVICTTWHSLCPLNSHRSSHHTDPTMGDRLQDWLGINPRSSVIGLFSILRFGFAKYHPHVSK